MTEIGHSYPDQLPGTDAVHYDYHPGNLLAANNTITGVVDWDGAGRGDRHFDLVTLRFGLHVMRCAPGVTDTLDELLQAMPTQVIEPAWAHMSLRMTDWAIRHHTSSEVDHWLDLAEG